MARSRKRTEGSPLSARHRWVLGIGLTLLGILLVGVAWMRTPQGQWLLADRGVEPAVEWASGQIEEALVTALVEAKVARDSIAVRHRTDDAPAVVRVRSDVSLLDLNLGVSRAVEVAGGTLHRGWRHEDPEGDWIELHVGTRRTLTHRLVARRGRPAPEPEVWPRGRLALVLDDLGHNFNALTRRALALPGPVTYAVLPELPYSLRALNAVKRAEKPVFLHMPMEPDPGAPVPPGEPAVMIGMDRAGIRAALRRGLDDLPGVVGINNHMGSRATRSREEMDRVMEFLSESGLVFFDSQTTPQSVAYASARDWGVPSLRNDLFIDRETEDPSVVYDRLEELADLARRRGYAVGIGHVNAATVEALERFLPRMRPADVQLVALPELIHDLAN